jgi:coenzyme F420-0:L-glutamate ligase/coenzyme F420-1:gamma-L-glutamate ligase
VPLHGTAVPLLTNRVCARKRGGKVQAQEQIGQTVAMADLEAIFWRLIRGRRSIRRYEPRPVPRILLEKLLEAATWAPSAHNRQPWRFCVVTSASTKRKLSDSMSEQWRRDLAADGIDTATIERRIAISHARLISAPALIVASLTMEDMKAYPDPRRAQAEWTMAVQSVALACQNLLLAAHFYGLGACWMCAPLFVPDLVRQILNLPTHWHPQALITVGYPAEERVAEREPLESRVVWR